MPERKLHVKHSPVFHIVVSNCFGEQINREILLHILSLKEHFKHATVGDGKVVEDYRNNTVCDLDALYHRPEFVLPNGANNLARIRAYRAQSSPLLREVDHLMQKDVPFRNMFETTPYPLCKFPQFNVWQTKVSRYGDENQFYKWHRDKRNDDRRLVTFVYYVYGLPKKFTGGEICLTNGLYNGWELVAEGETVEISPENDMLVIFGSRTLHMVKPTKSPPDFESGRFSVQIWAGIRGAGFAANNAF